MRLALVALAVALASPAFADSKADVTNAFGAFVDGVAAKKASADVDTFIAPFSDEEAEKPASLDATAALVKGKPQVVALQLAKSGTAAWIAAVIPGRTPLRASAFLTRDGGAWHVRAIELSAAVPNHDAGGMCGSIAPWWKPPIHVVEGTGQVANKLESDTDNSADARAFVPWLSADASAHMFGSAPNEQWTGGAAIKKVFEKWHVDLGVDKPKRTGIAPGGDLMWLALSVSTMRQCTNYRVLVVLAKESGGWKIVHQHYSEALPR